MGDSIAGAWASLAGTEIVNNARTFEYLKNGLGPGSIQVYGDCGCSDLFDVIGCFPPLVELDQYVDLPGTAGNYISTPDTPENSLQGTAEALRLTGHSGTFVSTPDSAVLSITGDIDIRVDVALDNWSNGLFQTFISKSEAVGNQRSYIFRVHTSGVLQLLISSDGITYVGALSTVSPGFAASSRNWIRATWNNTTDQANFYTSTDGITWNQLGAANVALVNTGIFDSTANLNIGAENNAGTTQVIQGTFYHVQILNGINNIVVANPDFTAAPWTIGDIASTARADSLGNVWTLNGNASIVAAAERRSLRLSGASGMYASAPDAASLDIASDIDIRVKVAMDDWTPTVTQVLMGKWRDAGNQRSYLFRVTPTGQLQLFVSQDGIGTPNFSSSVSVGAPDGSVKWLRATWVNATDIVTFYTSDDGVTWTPLGVTGSIIATGIFNSTSVLEVGSRELGTLDRLTGNVFYAEVRNGINGTIVANPNFQQRPWDVGETGGATGADAAGNTWTLNGAGAVIQRAFASDLDIRVKVALDDWTPATVNALVAKYNAGTANRAYSFQVLTNGRLEVFLAGVGGVAGRIFNFVTPVGFIDGTTHWVRATADIDNGIGGTTVTFYISEDGVNWTLLGTSTLTGTQFIYDSAAVLEIGSQASGTLNPLAGNVYYAEVRNGIDGVIVASFDANDTLATSATTPNTVTSSQSGEVWTINGAGWMWGNGAYTFPNFPYQSFPGYVSPATDHAPWYTPDHPSSAGFLGFIVDEFNGLDSPFTRSVKQSIGNGGVLSRARLNTRELTWRGFLFGESCCSVQYGLRWLSQTLSRFNPNCLDCQGDDLELLICCPDDAFAATGTESPFRTLKGVGLLEGPTILSQRKTCSAGCSSGCSGSCILEVEFTLVATQPWMYSPPIPVYNCINFIEAAAETVIDPDTPCPPIDCGLETLTAVGPTIGCPQPELPPTATYSNPCFDDLIANLGMTVYLTVPRNIWPDFEEVVPVITITNQSGFFNPGVKIGIFRSFNDNPCGDLTLNPPLCDALCDDLLIGPIPPNSSFYVDGRTRRMSVICPDESAFAGERLTNGPWSWPTFTDLGFCLAIQFDNDNPDMCVSLSLVPRSF